MSRIVPRFDFRVDIASESVTGKVRTKNEDVLLVAPEIALFAIADGMGGLSAGEVASRLAVDTAKEHLAAKASAKICDAYLKAPTLDNRRAVFANLHAACEAAHTRLSEEQETKKATMGSTLDLCLLLRDKAFIAHVGDARVFLVRPTAMLQLTEDHLVRDPMSVRGGAPRRIPRPLSTGIGLLAALRVDVFVVDLRKGDTLVLATDGAYNPFDDEAAIASACRGAPAKVIEQVIKHSLARGGRDNASLIVLKIEDRLVAHAPERGQIGGEPSARDDVLTIQHSALFVGLSASSVLAALSAGIEVEIEPGQPLKRFEAGDLCAYVVLEGVVKVGESTLGPPALVYAESLVGVDRSPLTAVVDKRARCLRIRRDDFREVAEHDPVLGLALYQRLAGHLART